MQQGGRLRAAIDVLQEVETKYLPVADVLSDWGRSHRFAGSSDRAAIAALVFDALRKKSSLTYLMAEDTPRARAIAVLAFIRRFSLDQIESFFTNDKYAPDPLSEKERMFLSNASLDEAPDYIRADIPEWLWSSFAHLFPHDAVEQGKALACRAAVDLRVNLLKADRSRLLKSLAHLGARATRLSGIGVRLTSDEEKGRNHNVEAESAFQKGWCEIQDEGSQIAALLSGVRQGQQVLDLCAGAGGKTLALAALMENKGQIYAYDNDKIRFKPIFQRLKRAAVRNVQTLPPAHSESLVPLQDRMDLVLVDAPCSGSGVWRRRPETKWRLSEKSLAARCAVQADLLRESAKFVKKGGSLVYVTCSLLDSENALQIKTFLGQNADFLPEPLQGNRLVHFDLHGQTSVQLTPASHDTDGFFIARLTRH